MSKKIDLQDNHFLMDNKIIDGETIYIHRRKDLEFKSLDSHEYRLNCTPPGISKKSFPFTVKADKKYHPIPVKGNAQKINYTFSLSLASGEKSDPRDDSPTMIVKVE